MFCSLIEERKVAVPPKTGLYRTQPRLQCPCHLLHHPTSISEPATCLSKPVPPWPRSRLEHLNIISLELITFSSVSFQDCGSNVLNKLSLFRVRSPLSVACPDTHEWIILLLRAQFRGSFCHVVADMSTHCHNKAESETADYFTWFTLFIMVDIYSELWLDESEMPVMLVLWIELTVAMSFVCTFVKILHELFC